MRAIDKYNILGIDERHLRGQHFDARDKRKDCFAESLGRNRNIRIVMRSYDRSYQSYLNRQGKGQKATLEPKPKEQNLIENIRDTTPERPFSLGLMAPKKYYSSSLMTADRHDTSDRKESSDIKTISYRTAQDSRLK